MTLNPIELEVFRHLFAALAEEMGAALKRAAFSPNIKERRDYSCALFDPDGVAVSMGDHMPVHLGAMPMSVEAALGALGSLAPGDVACLNDPFHGGTHLPDVTLIAGVHATDATLLGYVASRAHHSDVGGSTPGSMPLAHEIFEEGLRIPPVRLFRRAQRNDDLWALLLANVRTPTERAGDLDAQLAALNTGGARLREIVARRGVEDTLEAMGALIEYADPPRVGGHPADPRRNLRGRRSPGGRRIRERAHPRPRFGHGHGRPDGYRLRGHLSAGTRWGQCGSGDHLIGGALTSCVAWWNHYSARSYLQGVVRWPPSV